ncbi:MAG: (2Fe-2S)-binding protein [Solirubrobacterales bacterium]
MSETAAPPTRSVSVTVNGTVHDGVTCEDRELLVTFLRDRIGLKGTHAGCLNGDCGACTARVDGRVVKTCLMLAASADGAEITTIEGLGAPGRLSNLQEAFWDHDGFQCGFCLPGQLFAAEDLLESNPDPSDDEIRAALAGNYCRCTGYVKMIEAIRAAADSRSDGPGSPGVTG